MCVTHAVRWEVVQEAVNTDEGAATVGKEDGVGGGAQRAGRGVGFWAGGEEAFEVA